MASRTAPIITLTTDFGLSDHYVAEMKAALLTHCSRGPRLIDVSHEIPRHDILRGSVTLERAIDAFPKRTIHLAVVDPGVGSARRLLVVEIKAQRVVCPDNGLITWAWRRHQGAVAHELTWRPSRHSATFHGRDILAPVAAMLASGKSVRSIARRMDNPILLDIAPAATGAREGQIIHIDSFGNATTNLTAAALESTRIRNIVVGRRSLGPLRRTYSDVAPGKPLALIGSSRLLEIAVREGSAAALLRLSMGDRVLVADAWQTENGKRKM